jgi:predicted DNA-binding protein (MmcQ/YjbR family)
MDIETIRSFCTSFPHVSEEFPFDSSTLVFKVAGKIFALVDVDSFLFINLKCHPEKAIELRERFAGIQPGFHMNKKHWNSVYIRSDVSEKQLLELITHSYELVFESFSKKRRDELTMG